MRSLSQKLTLAFLFVSLTGAVLAAFFIQQRTRSEFDRFLFDQGKSELVNILTNHYRRVGSWEGIGTTVFQMPQYRRFAGGDGKHRPELNRLPFTLVGANGVIVFGRPDRISQPASQREIDQGVALEVDGAVVGWLVASAFSAFPVPETPEVAFLNNVNRAILISAVIAVVIALVLGATLARTLTRPIRELTDATRVVAEGELGYQVQVHSKDELGDLAISFNQMSSDLAKANQLRRQMTADIAHDLRTPLSVILGYAEALSEGKLQGNPEVFAVMHQESSHLNHLIEDLRTLALADSGELPLNKQLMQPKTLMERAVLTHTPQAEKKNLTLRVTALPELPAIPVDPERMAQVFGNLISNALRYTPAGGWIELSAAADSSGVRFQVRDNGIGIATEDLPHIFARFYRGDKSRQLNGEAGLGLAITKSLVEIHGGTISVDSQVGKGTTFTIRIPLP